MILSLLSVPTGSVLSVSTGSGLGFMVFWLFSAASFLFATDLLLGIAVTGLVSQGVHMFPWKVLGPGDDNSESINTLKVYCP